MLIVVLVLLGRAAFHEMQHSVYQARFFSDLARNMSFQLVSGKAPSDRVYFPDTGPFDVRMGYAAMPDFLQRLEQMDFQVVSQARWSNDLLRTRGWAVFPPYREKTQAGLELIDRHGESIYQARYPRYVFDNFESLAPSMVNSLLYIENRELLKPGHPYRNPAVEWSRMAKVSSDLALKLLHLQDENLAGGSTLATQIEKYRHSPDGLTYTPLDKVRQMGAASLRAYLQGPNTEQVRQNIVLDYINTVPLAARRGYGEVNGVGDGLWVWYERDPQQVNQILMLEPSEDEVVLGVQALAYKQVLSLFLAQRRPSHYLGSTDLKDLDQLTNVYVELLQREGVLPESLSRKAQQLQLSYGPAVDMRMDEGYHAHKAVNYARNRLQHFLNLPGFYALDRLDLSANTSFDYPLQQMVSRTLRELQQPDKAKQAGLYGPYLLSEDNDLSKIIYSFTLFERTELANVVRVQADNYDQPFDVNEGVKLDLGSTAKLRTLISYLNVIARVYERMQATEPELRQQSFAQGGRLQRWVGGYLRQHSDASLQEVLAAAMERGYSANPDAGFYTGGGLHHFKNFSRKYDHQVVSAQTALRYSINLPFIRMMRDVAEFYVDEVAAPEDGMLDDVNHPQRELWLAKFADFEGKVFLRRFYHKYRGRSAKEIRTGLLASISLTPNRFAIVYRRLTEQPDISDFSRQLRGAFPDDKFTEARIAAIFERYVLKAYSLVDQGYLLKLHPLELWLADYLIHNPQADWNRLEADSAVQRQEVYGWLYKTNQKKAQDLRIRQVLELEAFDLIHQEWKSLGYPFDRLVPSYATAIGSSADRPAALAELMGILVNEGRRMPTVRIDALHFAVGTPYETHLQRLPAEAEQIIHPLVAAQVRKALQDVVEHGTARRLSDQPFVDEQHPQMIIGGKTGTGDHRHEVFSSDGGLVSSVVKNRSATFVFYIGDRYFGTLTAFVPGRQAENYRFTSGLPVKILKFMAPELRRHLLGLPPLETAGETVEQEGGTQDAG